MSRTNIYQGENSCYGKKEGIYVTTPGVTKRNYKRYISLILRDYRRGYTYDHQCRKIPMSYNLAKRRLVYLIALAKKHGASKETIKKIKHAVEKAIEKLATIRRGKGAKRKKRKVRAIAVAR